MRLSCLVVYSRRAQVGIVMDSNVALSIVVTFIPLSLLFLWFRFSSLISIPGTTIMDCLPGGLVYPMIRDPRVTTSIMLTLFRRYGNIFSVWVGTKQVVVTSTPEDIVHILSAVDTFTRPPAMISLFETIAPSSIFSIPRNSHRVVRSKLRSSFNHEMICSFHARILECVSELCMNLTEHATSKTFSPVNISKVLSVITFRSIVNIAFGSSLSETQTVGLAQIVNDLVDEMIQEFISYPFRQFLTFTGIRKRLFQSRDQLRDQCKVFVNERQLMETRGMKNNKKDVLDALIDLKLDQPDALVSNVMVFTVAGAHTVNESLVWSLFETCKNPSILSNVHEELDKKFANRPLKDMIQASEVMELPYLNAVWKETLRMHPPAPSLTRFTTREVTLKGSGVTIPKGTSIYAFLTAAQNHPNYWKDAESFKPSRWMTSKNNKAFYPTPGSYFPFSHGPSNCFGKLLADHEALIILAELHRRFHFRLACEVKDVKSKTGWVQLARVKDGGLPIYVSLRNHVQ